MSETIQTKRCSKCKQFKELSEFSKDRRSKDKLQCYCKTCNRDYRQTEKCKSTHQTEKYKGYQKCYQKCYRQSEKGKIVNLKGVKKYKKTDKGKASLRRFYASHPNYIKAINAVNHAIVANKLPRPDTLLCHYCPKPAQQYHHWHGYEKEHWFDVVPVCRICHRKTKYVKK